MVTGKRKEAVARIQLKAGTGKVLVNGRSLQDYFPRELHQAWILEPLKATQTLGQFDCVARVAGGGISGQAGAIRQGVAKALGQADPNHRVILRRSGFLTRDSRVRERKKYGQKGARKRFQWTKR